MDSAARRTGRDAGTVTLIAVTKTVSALNIRRARDAGIEVFGENRVQEAEPKIGEVDHVSWHFIGHLQRNKARRAAELFDMIHSIDSERLAELLDRLGRERCRPVRALIEVNVAGEGSKSGVAPAQVLPLVDTLAGREGLQILGLMTVPPYAADPEASRPHFRALGRLAASIDARGLPGITMRHLSMGMSADFEVAIEEGATMVRVGSAIFGERPA